MHIRSLFDVTPKTAALRGAPTAPAAPAKPAVRTAAQEAVKAAAEEVQTKTAQAVAAPAPLEDLEKVAAEVAAKNREGTLKEAHAYGAAICDGFMERLAMYEKVAAEQNDRLAKEAQDAAAETALQVEGQIHKVAADHYLGGFALASELLLERPQ